MSAASAREPTNRDSLRASGEPQSPDLRLACRAVLERNWREGERDGVAYAYTAPSHGRYPWQWYWDSCFSAIAWRHFDRERSRRELESLLAAARDDGFIGHTIFWETPVTRLRAPFYNVYRRSDPTTATIQPPLLAWAWRVSVGDPARVPEIVRHHEWVEHERSIDDDGLLWIIQPDESGLDASPKFDSAFGWRADGLPGFPLLVQRNRRLRFDIRRVARAGGPLVCGTATNVLHGLSRLALGRPSITQKIVERLYDERRGVFHQIVRTGRAAKRRPRSVLTWAALSPLALPDLPEEIGRRLVEQQLLDPQRFWLPVPPPSVAASEKRFSRSDRFLLLRRYWRGPTWINAAWLLWLGLIRLGYRTQAQEMGSRIAQAVAANGLREYYDPFTGEGMGAEDFSWSALVMEFVDPAPAARLSHVAPRA
jgi:Mannosylglycerate hydrolase MGH1-like glycoside hydrolase domain